MASKTNNLIALFIITIIFVLTPWTYVVFKNYSVYLSLIFLTTIFLFLADNFKRKFYILALLSFLLLTLLNLKNDFDKNLFILSPTETKQINTRHIFYSQELGSLFTNSVSLKFYKRISFPLYKINRNMFYEIDPNLYFFGSHPRERAGIGEYEKFWAIFLPFFLIGFFIYLTKIKKYLFFSIYLVTAFLVSGFINPGLYIGPVLFFPATVIFIYLGIIWILQKMKILKK